MVESGKRRGRRIPDPYKDSALRTVVVSILAATVTLLAVLLVLALLTVLIVLLDWWIGPPE